MNKCPKIVLNPFQSPLKISKIKNYLWSSWNAPYPAGIVGQSFIYKTSLIFIWKWTIPVTWSYLVSDPHPMLEKTLRIFKTEPHPCKNQLLTYSYSHVQAGGHSPSPPKNLPSPLRLWFFCEILFRFLRGETKIFFGLWPNNYFNFF